MSLFTDDALDQISEFFVILIVPTTSISILAGYDPTFFIIGALGQFLAITMQYVNTVRKGKKVVKRPIWYWMICVFVLGGAMGFLFTNTVASITGMPKLVAGILSGAVAQYGFDFILAFKDSIIKMILKKDSDEEID